MPTTKDQLQRLTSRRWMMVILALLFGLALWQLLWMLLKLPAFILPSPAMVWQKFLVTLSNGLLWRHLSYTLLEVILGLMFGSSLAALLGYFLSKSPWLENFASPYLVASQSVPVVAIAPLLV
ncbi:MAG: hypothetical protein KA465_01125, partial [Anaerolineaceae bacterium]|nr:hypothetical protein [Anaerolineaceae bacterium]